MSKRAVYSVTVGGRSVTAALDPFLISIKVSDKAGATSDTAELSLDDTDGRIILPKVGEKVEIALGWAGEGAVTIFRGTIDDVSGEGSRSGRTISVSAKGVDTGEKSKAKSPKQKHFDGKTLGSIMKEAGQEGGISNVTVHPELANIQIDYEAMQDESFIAFGERIARDFGATFKVSQDRAVLVPRNSGQTASGQTLPTITAAWGLNMHAYKLSPILGRSRFKKVKARYYDQKEGRYKEIEVETKIEGAEAEHTEKTTEASETKARNKAKAGSKDSERESGGGSVTIEGNISAQPEGLCIVSGARPGFDGEYRIETVDHEYSRSSGFVTKLSLKRPDKDAGKDKRTGGRSSKPTTSSAVASSGFASPTQRA